MRGAFLAAAVALLSAAWGAPAAAEWVVCNHTSYVARAAVGFSDRGRDVTRGWIRIRPGECQVLKAGALTPGTHYFYAESSLAHREGQRRWDGPFRRCVDERDFSLTGDDDCDGIGFDSRGFQEIPIDKREWRTTLVEAAEFGRARARAAGVQRLLRDNGYGIRLIDGFAGRRTVREIRRYLSDEDLPLNTSEAAVIDRLEETALRRASEVGLTVCNETESMVWSAVALRASGGWESRGWWGVDPDSCTRLIDRPLEERAYYVYAAVEDGEGDRPLAAASETFCLAETRFVARGREDCEDRGYIPGRFAAVSTDDQSGVTMRLGPRDFSQSASGLRR